MKLELFSGPHQFHKIRTANTASVSTNAGPPCFVAYSAKSTILNDDNQNIFTPMIKIGCQLIRRHLESTVSRNNKHLTSGAQRCCEAYDKCKKGEVEKLVYAETG